MKKPIIFFDLECTGADKNLDLIRIIEISAIKVDPDTLEDIDILYYKCNNDNVPIAPDATERHGLKEEDLIGYPTFSQVAHNVYDFFKDCDLGGYYSTFYDTPILFLSFLRAGIAWDYKNAKMYDIHTLYKKYNTSKLGDVYEKYTGKKMEHAHEAEADIRATLAIYKEQRKRGEEFENDELETYKNYVDVSGNFKIRENENGKKEIYINFGKWKGVNINNVDISYFKWMIENEKSFSQDTISIAKIIYLKKEKEM